MSVETIARRYASALADVVVKSGQAETVQAELNDWQALIFKNRDLEAAFANPAIAHHDKENLLNVLISRTGPSKTTSNFLKVLLRNSRLIDLPVINDKFAEVLDDRLGITGASVTSARELTEDEKSELRRNLNSLTGREVKLSFEVDPAVIGGSVTRVGSVVYDGSVRTQLETLKEQMINS